MKTLLFLATLAFCLPGHSLERDIGVIVSTEKAPPEKPDITVSYVYDGKGQLFLTLGNIAMNSGARGVAGSLALHKAAIIISPKERYDTTGPVEGVSWSYTIRYVIPNVKPGVYTLVHDDTAAEGQDRVTRTVLDLTKATKATTTVTFKDTATDAKPKAAEPVAPPPFIKPEVETPAEGGKKAAE
ncbi:hypothetical protein OKA05_27135 [Luteolibacter arcticus]|uniref:Uncharacterized protein n=1 Tax=Luteolibacter arcticus TaxID=1581411 RepID=A0ABT3GRY1_9BACT|nr:hypothetical protein [Luteolibacter arcticus]MCW1926258.1 hypothetical protein [Luteolibacter arcticus]